MYFNLIILFSYMYDGVCCVVSDIILKRRKKKREREKDGMLRLTFSLFKIVDALVVYVLLRLRWTKTHVTTRKPHHLLYHYLLHQINYCHNKFQTKSRYNAIRSAFYRPQD